MRRKVFMLLAVLLFCVAAVATRAFVEGRSALAEGDAANAKNDKARAIMRWRRAARWYVPGASHPGEAYDRLQGLADTAAAVGDRQTELAALRAIRRSIYATRTFWTPHEERLPAVNRRISELMAEWDAEESKTPRSQEWHFDKLSRDHSPRPGMTWLAIGGLVLWLGSALYFARRGLAKEGALRRTPAIRAALGIIVGLVVWMAALTAA